ncbi:MAG: Tetratricopeptide TPR_2 repeat protein [Desulfonauticus sp. 38_4375]|jgi:tetratricopeptide (TPR) repeat protein|nr:MAG: Tetratricopeptide TPR_2 repeat protein [Desulfonauticus sp. 38_4375]
MSKKVSRRGFLRGMLNPFRRDEEEGFSGLSPLLVRGDKALEQGDFKLAIECYEKFLEEEPDSLEVLKKCGYAYFKAGEFEQSRKYFNKVMEVRPKENFCLLYLGLGWAKQGNLEQAVSYWKSYFNIQKPLVQRTINSVVALFEAKEDQDPLKVAKEVEEAILEQKKTK